MVTERHACMSEGFSARTTKHISHVAQRPITRHPGRTARRADCWRFQRSPAWNWNAELADPERTELDGLRGHVADLQAQTAQLRERADTATKTAQDLRAALTRLANATPRQRRRVTADLRASGLLS